MITVAKNQAQWHVKVDEKSMLWKIIKTISDYKEAVKAIRVSESKGNEKIF